jgi:hypothetical protein
MKLSVLMFSPADSAQTSQVIRTVTRFSVSSHYRSSLKQVSTDAMLTNEFGHFKSELQDRLEVGSPLQGDDEGSQ